MRRQAADGARERLAVVILTLVNAGCARVIDLDGLGYSDGPAEPSGGGGASAGGRGEAGSHPDNGGGGAFPAPVGGGSGSNNDGGGGASGFRIISGPDVVEITESDALIRWALSELATGQIDFGLTSTYGTSSDVEDSFDYSLHEQTLSSLAPDSLYHFKVRSKNAADQWVESEDATFTTAARCTLPIRRAPNPVTVDGVMSEYGSSRFATLHGGNEFRALWDDDALYFAIDVDDAQLATNGLDDPSIWDEDGLEIYLGPDGQHEHCEFSICPADFKLSLRVSGDFLLESGLAPFEPVSGAIVNVLPNGAFTINSPEPDTGYVVEIAIPWTALSLSGPPVAEERWAFAVTLDTRTDEGAYSQYPWCPSSAVPGHGDNDPDGWGDAVFSEFTGITNLE